MVQTARALENFQVSGIPRQILPGFMSELTCYGVKLAAAQANTDVGRMSKDKLAMIDKGMPGNH